VDLVVPRVLVFLLLADAVGVHGLHARVDLEAVAGTIDDVHIGQLANRAVDEVEGLAGKKRELHLAAMAVSQRRILADEAHAVHMGKRHHSHVGEPEQAQDDEHARVAPVGQDAQQRKGRPEGEQPGEENAGDEEERFHVRQDNKASPPAGAACDEGPDRGGEVPPQRRETR
jgi:hypothetical protein